MRQMIKALLQILFTIYLGLAGWFMIANLGWLLGLFFMIPIFVGGSYLFNWLDKKLVAS